MNHVELAFRNLQRRPARSILTILGVAVAVGSFITLYRFSRSAYENVQQSIEDIPWDLTIRRSGSAELFGSAVPQALVPQVAQIPGIAAVTGELISLAETDSGDHVLAAGCAGR